MTEEFSKVMKFTQDCGMLSCDAVIVGCSGGPDSMALLDILDTYRNDINSRMMLYCIHVNHNLRQGDCLDDEHLVTDFCKERNIPLVVRSFDVESRSLQDRLSEETEGRKLRYEAFDDLALSLRESPGIKSIRIAVAHHRDDMAETMMMNLFRGCGLEGLTCLKPVNGNIIRPLLCLSKDDIFRHLRARGINYATDKTNFDLNCTRNKWRNSVLPAISDITGRSAAEALEQTHRLLGQDIELIETIAGEAYEKVCVIVGKNRMLLVSEVSKLAPAVRSRVIRRLWEERFGSLTDFETVNLAMCDELISGAHSQGSVVMPMPFGRTAYRCLDYFVFCDGSGNVEDCACSIAESLGFITCRETVSYRITAEFAQELPNSDLTLDAQIIENIDGLEYNNSSWLCPADVIGGGRVMAANLAATAGGLVFRRAGSSSGKQLRRLFTDLKVPRQARRYIIFAHCGDEVLWIPGLGHAVGFTNDKSRRRYEESHGQSELVRIAIERKQH